MTDQTKVNLFFFVYIPLALGMIGFCFYNLHRESVKMWEDRQASCRRKAHEAYPDLTEKQLRFECEYGAFRPVSSGGLLP